MSQLRACLERAHTDALAHRQGEVASYIPELAKADSELFSLAACTIDGAQDSVGDDRHELTLQSLSKPFAYGWALDLLGPEKMRRSIGVEPSGDPFDAIIQLDHRNRPHNPMVNAGAIAVAGLLVEHGEGVASLLSLLGRFAGRTLTGVDAQVYLSESTAGHRNRAIAHLMRHHGMLAVPVEGALDLYFQQCSVLVTCRDLAVMAATLANGGRNPLTGEQVIPAALGRHVLTVMFTCGLYDAAGRFAFDVGLPAKSGVSGGVLAVVPGRLGIAAFAPPLDALGSSVRGVSALGDVAKHLGCHLLDPAEESSVGSPTGPDPALGAPDFALGAPDFALGAPDPTPTLRSVHRQIRGRDGGMPVAYLPRPDGDPFAIAICTVDGRESSVGDDDTSFTIQSAANPFGYGLAMQLAGVEAVHRRVGLEPSGNPFNAIVFDQRTEKPFNPLGNAGAIAVCSLIPGADPPERLRHLLEGFSAFAGADRTVVDAEVLAAEKAAGERNRAIASLLRNFGLLDDEAAALELYCQQCSIRTNCRQLARMGATLANGGVQPITGRTVLAPELSRNVLSVMLTCGLHDESGRFAFDVGLPAKTGISGGIVAVVPGRMGIAVYSPAVNDHASSVRGLLALQTLSERLGLSVFEADRTSSFTPKPKEKSNGL